MTTSTTQPSIAARVCADRSPAASTSAGILRTDRERHRLLRGAWATFQRGEIDTATEVLDPDARRYSAGEPDAEGACHSREQARAFVRRSLEDGISTELLDIRDAGEHRVVLIRHAHARRPGERGPHGELVTVRDGKITAMVVYPTV